MAEDGVGNLQDALDLLDFRLIEVELRDDVMPFPVVLDGIREPTLTPRGDLLDLAPFVWISWPTFSISCWTCWSSSSGLTMYINSYADKRYLLSYGICSGYGHAAAAEQESVRKSTKDWVAPNKKPCGTKGSDKLERDDCRRRSGRRSSGGAGPLVFAAVCVGMAAGHHRRVSSRGHVPSRPDGAGRRMVQLWDPRSRR